MSKFTSTDSGATILSKLNNTIVTVGMETGADYVCDGVADDVQLNAAIDYISGLGGGKIDVRRGTYNLTNPLVFTGKSNIIMSGEGASTVFQIPQASLANFGFNYMIYNASSVSENVIIENIRLYGGYSGYTTPPASQGGGITVGKKWILRNCIIEDFNYFGIWLGTNCIDAKVLDNIIKGPGRGPDHIGGGGGSNIEIAENVWESDCVGNCFDNTSGDHFFIHHNVIYGITSFYFEALTHVDCHHNKFLGGGNIVSQSNSGYDSEAVTSLTNSRYIKITDNTIMNGSITHHSATHATKPITISGDIIISRNEIVTPDYQGILVHGGSTGDGSVSWGTGYVVTDNIIKDANELNAATENTGSAVVHPSGINIAQAIDVVCEGNICVDTRDTPQQIYGIEIGQTFSPAANNEANRVIVSGNEIRGFVTGAINIVSPTYTTSRIRRNNLGDVTENSGTGTIASGATTAVITHGLSVTPTLDDISITFGEQGSNDYGRWWVGTITSTQFTLNVSADPGASNLDFAWKAIVL